MGDDKINERSKVRGDYIFSAWWMQRQCRVTLCESNKAVLVGSVVQI